ncbi:hypothetical protein SteCoe_15613 [Stentor coeruleus]|uniref:Uncharacterized protein n=1 Tax=Stentor coeruleus TaxID=5963 RepID=A0A1R2C3D0_9CILI|nr:hypothetical protein SteCoe_15613 [Stentor coeruleus]
MKDFKTRVVRPGSARPKLLVPGITEPSHADFAQLFIESRQKDIEFEKTKSKLLLHCEAKRSLDEKDILAKKYEESLKSMTETHQLRMKALTQQHELANSTLMDQFSREISMIKLNHKGQIDRIAQESQEKSSQHYEEILQLKEKHKKKLENLKNTHKKHIEKTEDAIKKHYESIIAQEKEKYEREKHDMCENAVRERDLQIKGIISKIYEESRKEWKTQEMKLNEEIRSLRFQLENIKLRQSSRRIIEISEPSVDLMEFVVPKFSLLPDDAFSDKPKEIEYVSERVERVSVDRQGFDKAVQTVNESILSSSISCQADLYDSNSIIKKIEDQHAKELEMVEGKIVSTLHTKNTYISTLESRISSLVVKNKELEALLRQLNC